MKMTLMKKIKRKLVPTGLVELSQMILGRPDGILTLINLTLLMILPPI